MRQILGRLKYYAAMVLFVLTSSILSVGPAALAGRAFADGSLAWTGQGTSNGSLNTVQCSGDTATPGTLLWVFSLGGGQNTVTSATLALGGSGSGTYTMTSNPGNEMKVVTPYFNLSTLTASVSYVGDLGTGNPNLVISHGCPSVPTTTVTPAAVTFKDDCGTANDTYTIPITTGVDYQINGATVAAGDYPASGTVTVSAVAQAGYTLTGTTEWSQDFTDVSCGSQPKPVVPTAPTFNDVCGTTNDTFTIPSETGVQYYGRSAGTYPGSGTVTIDAIADSGYTLINYNGPWVYTFTDVPCNTASVTLCHATDSRKNPYVEITVNAAGAYNGHLGHTGPIFSPSLPKHTKWGDIIPTFTYNGQQYSLNVPAGQTILDNHCQMPAPPKHARPAAVTFTDLCGTENDVYTIPTTTGVDYQVNGQTVTAGDYPGSGTVTVTAVAQQGYVLKGKTSWTFHFTNKPCTTTVRPPRVTFANPTCENPTLGSYTIPNKAGVVYKDAAGNVLTSGRHTVTVSGSTTITITAYPANNNVVLTGTTTWTHTFHVANGCGGGGEIPQNPNITVTPGACVPTALPTGTATVTVTNPNNFSVDYLVDLGNNMEQPLTVGAGQTGSVTFTGLAAGTYQVTVRGDDDTMRATGSVTITTCPPVIPPSNGGGGGQVLGASTTVNTPSVGAELTNTGASTVLPTILAASMAVTAAGVMYGSRQRRKLSSHIDADLES